MLNIIVNVPLDITVVQLYPPTTSHGEDDIEEFYEDVEKAVRSSNTGRK